MIARDLNKKQIQGKKQNQESPAVLATLWAADIHFLSIWSKTNL